ncbi:ribosome-associated protein [Nocardioides scoriae]|uniref:Ribosome-associated protein n=1 Tax=Nocardioides scoriae TaxID=642780 RepID=A0A1H1R7U1_9ACTN|nr:alternative ribosome rescue aminoacyl-tRNA hydrolase ArfB [Nocardioides scoriae]SDS31576.1 ribosome-associated protein [Nocardioides scoriae]
MDHAGEPGSGLRVRPGPGLPQGLLVPEGDLVERFSRSSGPGGQSVNTTDSRVEVVLDLTRTSALSDDQRRRAVERVGAVLSVTASEQRSQLRNRTAARQRLADRLREALAPPPVTRVPTKPTRGSKRRRLEAKSRRGRTKQLRGRVTGE